MIVIIEDWRLRILVKECAAVFLYIPRVAGALTAAEDVLEMHEEMCLSCREAGERIGIFVA